MRQSEGLAFCWHNACLRRSELSKIRCAAGSQGTTILGEIEAVCVLGGIAKTKTKERNSNMKKTTILSGIILMAASSFALAGTPMMEDSTKMIIPPEPPPVYYGTGFYMGLQAGANFYQDFGATKRFTIDNDDIAVGFKQKIGFVGGGKIGYVFGTGRVRPAIEFDGFYNGVKAAVEAKVNGKNVGSANSNLNSGAFLGNFILRFAFDRFQPYFGAGAGGWVAEANNIKVNFNGQSRDLGSAGSNSGFAWQVIAGSDYYWTPKFSTFLEYKFLNYQDAGAFSRNIPQQIGVLGVRWHF